MKGGGETKNVPYSELKASIRFFKRVHAKITEIYSKLTCGDHDLDAQVLGELYSNLGSLKGQLTCGNNDHTLQHITRLSHGKILTTKLKKFSLIQ